MKLVKKILIYLLFLCIGGFIFWLKYKDLDKETLLKGLRETNYLWIILSLFLGLFSHYIRAVRWKMLINPLGYNPKTGNVFLSVLILYFVNLLVPRAGEVARCTVLSKYEKIPAFKLIGTMIVERIADTLTMLMLAVIIFIINLSVLQRFFEVHPEFGQNIFNLLTLTNIIFGLITIILIIAIILLIRPNKDGKIYGFIRKIKTNLKEGVKSILMLENKWHFIGYTLLIFLIWLLMLYCVFLAYPPTNHLTVWTGMFIFLMGALAMLMPVQGGIGPWHFMVIESLFLYGIDKTDGKIFALIAHSTTNLIYLFFGLIAMFLFPLVNKKLKQKHN